MEIHNGFPSLLLDWTITKAFTCFWEDISAGMVEEYIAMLGDNALHSDSENVTLVPVRDVIYPPTLTFSP